MVQVAMPTVMSARSYPNLGAWILESSGCFEEFLTELYGEIPMQVSGINGIANTIEKYKIRESQRRRKMEDDDSEATYQVRLVIRSLLQHMVDVVILTQPLSRKPLKLHSETE
jgi:hypothetical protein